jgi:S-methylmethionine-dependent homocysteine/selenocysteine methylase
MPSLMEARSAASAATETGVPAWLGLRVAPSGAHLPSGDPIEAVWQEVAELPLAGLLLSPPDRGSAAMVLEGVSRLASVPLGAWLDGLAGGPTDGADADDLGADVDRWFEAGATLVGIASGATPRPSRGCAR